MKEFLKPNKEILDNRSYFRYIGIKRNLELWNHISGGKCEMVQKAKRGLSLYMPRNAEICGKVKEATRTFQNNNKWSSATKKTVFPYIKPIIDILDARLNSTNDDNFFVEEN